MTTRATADTDARTAPGPAPQANRPRRRPHLRARRRCPHRRRPRPASRRTPRFPSATTERSAPTPTRSTSAPARWAQAPGTGLLTARRRNGSSRRPDRRPAASGVLEAHTPSWLATGRSSGPWWGSSRVFGLTPSAATRAVRSSTSTRRTFFGGSAPADHRNRDSNCPCAGRPLAHSRRPSRLLRPPGRARTGRLNRERGGFPLRVSIGRASNLEGRKKAPQERGP